MITEAFFLGILFIFVVILAPNVNKEIVDFLLSLTRFQDLVKETVKGFQEEFEKGKFPVDDEESDDDVVSFKQKYKKKKRTISATTQVTSLDFYQNHHPHCRLKDGFRPYYLSTLKNHGLFNPYFLDDVIALDEKRKDILRENGVQTLFTSVEDVDSKEFSMIHYPVETLDCGVQTDSLERSTNSTSMSIWATESEFCYRPRNATVVARRILEVLVPTKSRKNRFFVSKDMTTLNWSGKSFKSIPQELYFEFSSITKLDLSNNMIHDLPSSFFKCLEQLVSLDLSNNYLFTLTGHFSRLKKLKTLDVSHNLFQFFPSALCNLGSLMHLNLSHNSLLAIPNDIIKLRYSLQQLDLSHNDLLILPTELTNLRKIKQLHFEGNNFLYPTRSYILKRFSLLNVKNQDSNLDDEAIEPLEEAETGPKPRDDRIFLLFQLLENESEYLHWLNVFMELFYIPLTSGFDNTRDAYDLSINPEDVDMLFAPNFLSIITFSRSLFIDLKTRLGKYEMCPLDLEKANIGEMFLKRKAFFQEIYVRYINVYDEMVIKLRELMQQHSSLKEFILNRQKSPLMMGYDLQTIFCLPLKRIAMLHSMIKKILRNTPIEHRDHRDLCECLKYLNEFQTQESFAFEEYNNKYKIINIEQKLKIKLIKPGRKLLKEGKLIIAPSKGLNKFISKIRKEDSFKEGLEKVLLDWKDKTTGDIMETLWSVRLTELYVDVYLFTDCMVVKETNILHQLVGSLHQYDLHGAHIAELPVDTKRSDNKKPFCVITRKNANVLFNADSSLADEWIRVIGTAIDKLNEQVSAPEDFYSSDDSFADNYEDDLMT